MTTHELKCLPDFFRAMKLGLKSFEYRKNDRNFQLNDMLFLREYEPEDDTYTGRALLRRVTFLVTDCPGLPDGYCVMQVEPAGTPD